ncbi:ribosomal protein S18-alanine N-acetyltransferase [Francisellaceae bacterium]|nr:ribosomal protein S18-alanine N-acetyltransferase [Francisellaceae bacterium]
MNFVVRVALPKDVKRLEDIENNNFDYDQISRRQFLYHLNHQKNILLVVALQNNIAGYVLACCHLKSARIYSIVIDHHFRGKGLAQQLLSEVINRVSSLDVSHIRLEVKVDNQPAIHLYNKLGFLPAGEIKKYYSNNEDALMMVKFIS